jgi:HEAT repeat protein
VPSRLLFVRGSQFGHCVRPNPARRFFRLLAIYAIFAIVLSGAAMGMSAQSTGVERHPCYDSSAGEDQLIDFLHREATTRTDPACIEQAIERLGATRSIKAVPTLIELLDFPEPLSMNEEAVRSLISGSHYTLRYKAIEALFNIGLPAIPNLLHILRDPYAPPIQLKNALDAYLDIRREDFINARKYVSSEMAIGCPSLQDATEQALISFLEENKGRALNDHSNCVASTIVRLGMSSSLKAIKILLDYINYESPDTASTGPEILDPDRPQLYRFQHHPAVTALYMIGTPALLQLLHVLESPSSSTITNSRVVEVIMLMYAEYPPQGISIIQSAAAKDSPDVRSRILRLAASAVKWCDIEHRVKCRELSAGSN